MKNIMNKVRSLSIKDAVKGAQLKTNVARIFTETKGEGFVDTAIKILMAVVIGALVLAGLYALFGDVVLPTLTERITDMFDYQG